MKKLLDSLVAAFECKRWYDTRKNYFTPLADKEVQTILDKLQKDRITSFWV